MENSSNLIIGFVHGDASSSDNKELVDKGEVTTVSDKINTTEVVINPFEDFEIENFSINFDSGTVIKTDNNHEVKFVEENTLMAGY